MLVKEKKMKKLSVIVPMYNEEEVANICYDRLTSVLKNIEGYDYEILFVNDGSKDKTLEILMSITNKDNRTSYISFSRNFGHQAAVVAGLKNVSGDAAIIIDADMQDPPEVIPDMVKKWEEGNEVVYAVRKSRKGETKFKLLSAKAFYRLLNKLSDVNIPCDTGDFRLIDRKAVNCLNELPEHNKFMRGLVSWVGFRQTPLEYERQERVAGKTKYPLGKMMKLALDGIINFSTKPLKIIGVIGIFAIIISFLLLVYTLVSYVFNLNHLTPGWASIMVTITFLSGLQFMSIWIMSEYIARIYDEARHRPEYIIDEKGNADYGREEK